MIHIVGERGSGKTKKLLQKGKQKCPKAKQCKAAYIGEEND